MNLTKSETKAIKAMVKYMRKPVRNGIKVAKQLGGDGLPDYVDDDSFIRLADEARIENNAKEES